MGCNDRADFLQIRLPVSSPETVRGPNGTCRRSWVRLEQFMDQRGSRRELSRPRGRGMPIGARTSMFELKAKRTVTLRLA